MSNEIKTWKEIVDDQDIGDGVSIDHPIFLAMKREISELRAALAASGGNAALTDEKIKGICITSEHAGFEEGMRVAKSYLSAASAPNAALVAALQQAYIYLEAVRLKTKSASEFGQLSAITDNLRDALSAAGQEVGHAWQPIESAPKDGKTVLLGCFNSMGNWRTMRGQWFSQDLIADEWEDAGDSEAGWYETAVEPDVPNCWAINPTHWQPLPTQPQKP